ncbi:hypothetical protein ISL63_002610 [Salmonella enterica]|uniref:hypothetical protein n=1 Tax=Escherichia coli TaxID=562 RepID=UPI0012D0C302|nr:hypothetical protein [Escherichia coli]ECZ0744848.1 hypothetical protein [Salmonella enterica]EGN6941645.1 hypothetical protein [Salmonella enterica]EKZ3452416.1 hypothetical protein [Escherichia coli]ELD8673195.1 hypothetical protein [Escherichia coli]ELO5610421.1 hypothetical protein [Escherichia coli]
MELLWKPLWVGVGTVIIGVILLELIPEHKKAPRKAAVTVISIGVALMLAVACGMLAVMMLPTGI